MIVLLGIVVFVVGSMLSFAQATQGRSFASFAVGVQLVGIIGLLLLGTEYSVPLGLFILGTLLGSVAAFWRRRQVAH